MTIAANQEPKGCLKAERVYNIACQENKDALANIITGYNLKLDKTISELRIQQQRLEKHGKRTLTDKEVNKIFCTKVSVPVTIPKENVDKTKLYPPKFGWGLTTDFPCNEATKWARITANSRAELSTLLRQPRRALRHAVGEFRTMNTIDEDRAPLMNEFQFEDVQDYIDVEESEMVQVPVDDIHDASTFTKGLDAADQSVRDLIATRSGTRPVAILTVVTLLMMFLGFAPVIIAKGSHLYAMKLAIIAVLLLGLCALICLLIQWGNLRGRIKEYRQAVEQAVNRIDNALLNYSNYLSHACNAMRGYSVLNYCETNGDPDEMHSRIILKHLNEVCRRKADCLERYAQYINSDVPVGYAEISAFQYDFTLPLDYTYDVSYDDYFGVHVPYFQKGVEITDPSGYLQSLYVKREELYD